MELAADESVILAYWQLRDGVADHDWLHGLKYRSASKILEPAYQKAAALRPGLTALCAISWKSWRRWKERDAFLWTQRRIPLPLCCPAPQPR